jgi:hypothetical protein
LKRRAQLTTDDQPTAKERENLKLKKKFRIILNENFDFFEKKLEEKRKFWSLPDTNMDMEGER